MRRPIALIATLLLSLTASAEPRSVAPRIKVPRAIASPKIDGKINSGEWRGAVRLKVSETVQAMLVHDGAFLYIALVGRTPGIGSLCTMSGEDVLVLHASAALGTARFEREKKAWRMTRGFTFTNRDTSDNPTAQLEKKATLNAEGWFANTSRTSLPVREYQLHVAAQRQIPLTLGFMTYTEQDQTYSYWPNAVVDGCAESMLASGHTDMDYVFDPATWGVAELE
jgi:hypothetical protein